MVAALRLLGTRKAGTPLAIASMPVSAVVPDEKARAMRKARAKPAYSCSARISQPALSAISCSPLAILTTAVMTMTPIVSMNRYVGMAKSAPASRTPRRFRKVIPTIASRAMATV